MIYLGGIVNESELSRHLQSRRNVDAILRSGDIPVTTLKAGIVVGSGSSSFEIIRDLVEKLPVMVTPKWLDTRIQPIAIRELTATIRENRPLTNTPADNLRIHGVLDALLASGRTQQAVKVAE